MDIGLIGVTLGVFSGSALAGVYAQMSGRSLMYRIFPPDRIWFIKTCVVVAFIAIFFRASGGEVADWSVWYLFLVITSNAVSSASGYIAGYLAMAWMKEDDESNDDSQDLKRDDKN